MNVNPFPELPKDTRPAIVRGPEGRRTEVTPLISNEGLPLQNSQANRVLLASIRHELRTPINAILGYSEMLLEDAAIPDLQRIHAAGTGNCWGW